MIKLDTEKLAQYEVASLFEMVYQWGRVGIVVDETAPAFLSQLATIVELSGGTLPMDVCSLCGASPMTTNCNNGGCDE